MNYPDNYNIPAFPAGTRIASSRVATIGAAIVFVLILFMCAILIWTRVSVRVHPFLVSVGDDGVGEWTVVGHEHGDRRTITATRAMQESLIGKYVRGRFNISDSMIENESSWTACNRDTDCSSYGNYTTRANCRLFCVGTDEVFNTFVKNIVPDYRARAAVGERWAVNLATVQIRPAAGVSENGGLWRATFMVQSNMEAAIEVVAYVLVARNARAYPGTLGYYIADFNAYRVN